MIRALEGVRVLDPSQSISGPFCSKMLALFGAEVIKVEPPGLGDAARRAGPFPDDLPHPEKSGLFLQLNTSKKSITLDLSTATGADIFKRLAERADLVVENFEPGTMARFGLSYQDLSQVNPRLVMTSISSFGQDGPYRDYKGGNLIVTALSGLLYVMGDPDKPPLKTGGSQADYIAGLNAFVASMLGLTQRDLTGEGVYIDLSAHESMVANLEYIVTMYTFLGAIRGRWYSRHPFTYPNDIYPCKDGYLTLIPGRGGGFASLALMLERPEMAEDDLFKTLRARVERSEELEELLRSWLIERERDEVVQLAQDLRMPFAPVLTTKELLADAQLESRGFFTELDHPYAGRLPYANAPFQFSETPSEMARPPLLGEHNEEILCGLLGYSKRELTQLRERGVI